MRRNVVSAVSADACFGRPTIVSDVAGQALACGGVAEARDPPAETAEPRPFCTLRAPPWVRGPRVGRSPQARYVVDPGPTSRVCTDAGRLGGTYRWATEGVWSMTTHSAAERMSIYTDAASGGDRGSTAI